MFSIAYIIFVFALGYGAQRYLPRPIFKRLDFATGFALLSFIFMLDVIGWGLPEIVNSGLGWGLGPGWLERGARIIGAAGGIYLAIRAAALWLWLFLLGLVVIFVGTIGRYVVLGHL